jgi:hypothetical protein
MNPNLSYEEVVAFLEDAFPPLRDSSAAKYRDLPYVVAGHLALLLREMLEAGSDVSEPQIARAFEAIDHLGTIEDDKIRALLNWGILEVLTDPDAGLSAARAVLRNGAREAVEDVLTFWGDPRAAKGG